PFQQLVRAVKSKTAKKILTTRPHYCRKAPNPNSDQRKKRRRKTGDRTSAYARGYGEIRPATAREEARRSKDMRAAAFAIVRSAMGKAQRAKRDYRTTGRPAFAQGYGGQAGLPDHGTAGPRDFEERTPNIEPC